MNENKGDNGTQCYVSTPIDGHVIINSILHSLIGNSSLANKKKQCDIRRQHDNFLLMLYFITIVIGRFVINRDVRT